MVNEASAFMLALLARDEFLIFIRVIRLISAIRVSPAG